MTFAEPRIVPGQEMIPPLGRQHFTRKNEINDRFELLDRKPSFADSLEIILELTGHHKGTLAPLRLTHHRRPRMLVPRTRNG